jgi:hypothetical protein
MIEMLEGFPESAVAFAAKGKVTKEDYERVLVPAVEAAFQRRGRIRFYYEIGPDCTGFEPAAMWQDTKLGVKHWTQWDRSGIAWPWSPMSNGSALP